jgi:hypothetical protein
LAVTLPLEPSTSTTAPFNLWVKFPNDSKDDINILINYHGIEIDNGVEQENRLEFLVPSITLLWLSGEKV